MFFFIPYIFFVLFFAIFMFKASSKLNLLDYPSDRKQHSKPVPYIGGIIIIFSYLFSILLKGNVSILDLIFLYSTPIFIIGLLDDKYKISVKLRLIFQSFFIVLSIIFTDLLITDLGNYSYGFLDLGIFSVIFTVACVLTMVNGINYLDGLDGVAGFHISLILVNIFFLSSSFLSVNDIFVILYPIIIFIYYNFISKNKIFLGNNGSAGLGFIVALTIILFSLENNVSNIELAWLLWFVVYEFLSTTLSRLLRGINPFTPGKDHIHYLINYRFHSVIKTNILIILLYEVIFLLLVIFINLNNDILLILFVLCFFVYFILRELLVKLSRSDINSKM